MYNFQEKGLGPTFAKEKMADFKRLIEASQSFTVVSMPGVGVSYFLKYLTSKSKVLQASSKIINTASEAGPYFVHVDLYNLPTLNQHEFYRMFLRDLAGNPDGKSDEQVFLETKEIIKKMVQKNEKVVIIFSRFDQLRKDFDENFLSNLQSLTTLAPNKIMLIFTAIKPLYELTPDAVSGGNLPFYSKILYFKPYSNEDLKKLFLLEHTQKAHPNLDEVSKLSGGHIQLLNIFMNSQKANNLLLDKFVTLQLKDLYNYLDYQQKKDVQRIALGKTTAEVDEYLLGVGYAQSTSEVKKMQLHLGGVKFRLFSPVLAEYIKTNLPSKLPVKEATLFRLLRNNMSKVVSKDEIFANVWQESDEATDWALDALIYRLRNSQFMKTHGYAIESHKKVGYTLIQV